MNHDSDPAMAPDASPGQQSKRSGVRRVNNLPVYIVVGILAIFLFIMVLVAADRAAGQRKSADRTGAAKGGSASVYAKEIAGDRKDGLIQAKSLPSSLARELAQGESVPIGSPSNPEEQTPMLVPPGSQFASQEKAAHDSREEQTERIRVLKLQQFEEAVRAKTSVTVTMSRSPGSAGVPALSPLGAAPGEPATRDEAAAKLADVRRQIEDSTRDDPTAAYKARLHLIQGAGAGAGSTRIPTSAVAAANDIGRFSAGGQGDRWRLEAQPEAPRTPYELRAGFVIPAILISGINSELPGQIIAQVSQDVSDTPLGRYKLIPLGSRLVGSYASEVAYGQSSIFITWQRIVFPDGRAMDIGAMPGADSAGYAGFKDQVNNHYARLFSGALLMSGVTAGIALSQPGSTNPYARPTASSALSEALGQQLGQVTAQLVSKNMNTAPTLQIRPGYRFNVIVIKDLTFPKPYVAFDY